MDSSFSLTDEAVNKIKELRPTPESALRIKVQGGGCSGLLLDVSWAEAPEEDDCIVLGSDYMYFVDKKSALFLKSFVLDYDVALTNGGFKLKPQNSKDTTFCGCGKSFSI
jgi:iron-sulfur cluster assembly protein